jgi:hypothetical protein
MPTKDDLDPEDPLPLFLSGEPEPHAAAGPQDRAVVRSRVLVASILVVAGTAIGIGILPTGNSVRLFADVMASMMDKSALQPGTDQWRSPIQSSELAEDLLSSAKDAPTRDEIAAALKSAHQHQIENETGEHEALFREFQAWAAAKDAQGTVGLAQPVQDAPGVLVQDGPAQVAENARAPLQPMKKNSHKERSARAEIRALRHALRKKVRSEQTAGGAKTAQAQEQSVENAQAPSFLQMFGWRN